MNDFVFLFWRMKNGEWRRKLGAKGVRWHKGAEGKRSNRQKQQEGKWRGAPSDWDCLVRVMLQNGKEVGSANQCLSRGQRLTKGRNMWLCAQNRMAELQSDVIWRERADGRVTGARKERARRTRWQEGADRHKNPKLCPERGRATEQWRAIHRAFKSKTSQWESAVYQRYKEFGWHLLGEARQLLGRLCHFREKQEKVENSHKAGDASTF